MSQVRVTISGCDDETAFTLEVDQAGLDLLRRLVELADEHSEYGCMPRMYAEAVR